MKYVKFNYCGETVYSAVYSIETTEYGTFYLIKINESQQFFKRNDATTEVSKEEYLASLILES